MVKASSQIEQELALLQTQTEQMAEALEPLYEGYLKALSEAGKQQLMMAAYHLCTQAYPDKFLALSWDQRHRLQQTLQAIAGQIYEQLTVQRSQAQKMSRQPQQQQGLAFLQRLLAARSGGSARVVKARDFQRLRDLEDGEDGDELGGGRRSPFNQPNTDSDDLTAEDFSSEDFSNEEFSNEELVDQVFSTEALQADNYDDEAFDSIDFEDDDGLDEKTPSDEDDIDFEMDVPAADQRLTLTEEEDLLAALEGLARRSLQTKETVEIANDEAGQPLAPAHLMKQQILLEKAIQDVFSAISEEANALLQKSEIMPSFPKALLAAATDPRGLGEPVNAVPNVVKMSVRVMHGDAFIDSDADDELDDHELDDIDSEDMTSNDKSRREPPERRPEKPSEEPPEEFRYRRDERRRREPNSRRSDRISSRRDSSKRMTGRSASSMRRITPRKIQEIDALPDLAAISMRLSEIEFTDPAASAWRNRLRQKLSELKKLAGRYKKAQKSLETAQAEDAWRASWTVRQADELT